MVPRPVWKGKEFMSMNLKQMRGEILMKREELKDLIVAAKQARAVIKNLRAIVREEAKIARVVKEDHRRAVREAREAKKAERNAVRIQKLEAKLLALKSPKATRKATRKANQKASAAKVYSADEIAALNAARSYSAGAANAALNRANWIASLHSSKGVA